MESQEKLLNAQEIYAPVRSAIKAIIELHRLQTNPEHLEEEKMILKEMYEDLEKWKLEIEGIISKPQ